MISETQIDLQTRSRRSFLWLPRQPNLIEFRRQGTTQTIFPDFGHLQFQTNFSLPTRFFSEVFVVPAFRMYTQCQVRLRGLSRSGDSDNGERGSRPTAYNNGGETKRLITP